MIDRRLLDTLNEQVKHVFESVNDVEVTNIAMQGDIVEALKRFVMSEKEPDLKKRAIAIILAQKQMLSLCHAYFPDKIK